jgi:NAD(P)-dependent dehydrogenase (short-subunit alcohol dehydrogenase family)
MAVSENPPTIIITGSSRGLGAAIVDYLLDNSNANLVLNSRSPSGHKSPRTVHLCADMGHEGTGKKLVELAIEKFGRLDAVVVNHGVVDPVARLEEADVKDWKDSFEINVFGVVELVWLQLFRYGLRG